MTDWPDPARPGYPLNPERDGLHWVAGTKFPTQWLADEQAWESFATGRLFQPAAWAHYPYLGPCLTPDEAAEPPLSRDAERRLAIMVCAVTDLELSAEGETADALTMRKAAGILRTRR